jgi:hypothetical protein
MMPQPPNVKAETESRKQQVATLVPMKNMPHPDGSISLGSATASSLKRKVSLRHNTAIIVFLWEGKGGSASNAMKKAKAMVSKQLSLLTTRNLTVRNS